MTLITITAFITITAWVFYGAYQWLGVWGVDALLIMLLGLMLWLGKRFVEGVDAMEQEAKRLDAE